jgi:hypothetical protein
LLNASATFTAHLRLHPKMHDKGFIASYFDVTDLTMMPFFIIQSMTNPKSCAMLAG